MTTDLRSLFGHAHFATAADAELLARYTVERDDLAFAELVHRHAPAVYAACRRFLSAPADVDDAFQAVFVLLAQKAGRVADPTKLSGWLCGAAGRIARRVRRRAAKRAATEKSLADVPDAPAPDAVPSTDLKAVLDEELSRLPPAYREVVALCDVDGVSRRTAAERLGVPESTLSNRLTRARALLGGRLLRRGVALGAGLSLSAVSLAAVPPTLVPLTVSHIAADSVPPNILSLAAEGASLMPPLKVASLLLAGLLFAGVGFVSLAAQEPVKAPPPVAKKLPAPPEPVDPEPEAVTERYPAMAAAYSRDGKRFALALRGANEVRVYDAATWQVLHTLDVGKQMCFGLQFSADGGTLYAAGDDGPIRTFDTKTGKAGRPLDAKAGPCSRLQLSPDGKRLAAGHYDYRADKPDAPVISSIQIWDAATGKLERSIVADEPVSPHTLQFSPDGKVIAAGCSASDRKTPDADGFHGVVEWDAATGEERKRYDTPRVTPGATPTAHAIAYTTDGKKLILGGGEAVPHPGRPGGTTLYGYLWVIDRETGEVDKTLVSNREDYIRTLALSPDGKRLYVPAGTLAARAFPPKGNPNAVRRVYEFQGWDTETWEVAWTTTRRETSFGMELAVSPDGRRIGIGGPGGYGLFDAQSGEAKGGLLKVLPKK